MNGRPPGGYERVLAVRGKRESPQNHRTTRQDDSRQLGAAARRLRQMAKKAAQTASA